MVPIKSSLNTLFDNLDFCRHELKIKQVTLLELLYYPHISAESKKFFANEHINLLAEVAPKLEQRLKNKFKCYRYLTQVEKSLYYIESPSDGFKVFIKQANRALRSRECYQCNHFCQEGLYEMRLSLGGWLSVCNIPNEHGVDLSKKENLVLLDKHMQRFKRMLSRTRFSPFDEFVSHHQLQHYTDH
jgi:hypothetical protein